MAETIHVLTHTHTHTHAHTRTHTHTHTHTFTHMVRYHHPFHPSWLNVKYCTGTVNRSLVRSYHWLKSLYPHTHTHTHTHTLTRTNTGLLWESRTWLSRQCTNCMSGPEYSRRQLLIVFNSHFQLVFYSDPTIFSLAKWRKNRVYGASN